MALYHNYREATKARVARAFADLAAEYDPLGVPVLLVDVAARSAFSYTTVSVIALQSDWWTAERRRAASLEACRRGRVATLAGHNPVTLRKKQEYAAKMVVVIAAFHALAAEYDAKHQPMTLADLAQHTGVSLRTVRRMAREGDWWTEARKHDAFRVRGQKIARTNKANGSVNTQQLTQHPDVSLWRRRGHLTQSVNRDVHPNSISALRGRLTRQKLLAALQVQEWSSLSQLALYLHMSRAAVSKHLRRLRDEGAIDQQNHLIVAGDK